MTVCNVVTLLCCHLLDFKGQDIHSRVNGWMGFGNIEYLSRSVIDFKLCRGNTRVLTRADSKPTGLMLGCIVFQTRFLNSLRCDQAAVCSSAKVQDQYDKYVKPLPQDFNLYIWQ
jgi:hypothetical protein